MTMQEFYKKAISHANKTGKTLDQIVKDWEGFDRKIGKLNNRVSYLEDIMLSLCNSKSVAYRIELSRVDELQNTIDFLNCAEEDE